MKRTNPRGNCQITTTEIKTPNDIEVYLKSFNVVKDVQVLEYLDVPALVIMVKLNFWSSLRYMIDEDFGWKVQSLKYGVFRNIPKSIETKFIVVL